MLIELQCYSILNSLKSEPQMHIIYRSNRTKPCFPRHLAIWNILLFVGASSYNCHAAFRAGGGYVIGDIAASTAYTTNAQSNSNAESDLIFKLTPSLSYTTDQAIVHTAVTAGVTATRYNKLNDNDSEHYNIRLNSSFPNEVETPYSVDITLSVSEQAKASAEFGRIISSRNYSAGTGISYTIGSRYSIQSGFEYGLSQGLSEGTSNIHAISFPLSFSYIYSENLSYGLGYRHRRQEVSDEGISSIDHAVFLQASGQLLPLISGSIALGTQVRTTQGDSPNEQLAPYASGNLNWKATQLTTYTLDLAADFQTSTGNNSSRGYSAQLSAAHNFDSNLNGNVSIGWGNTNYTEQGLSASSSNRSDTEWTIGSGLSSSIGEHIALSINLDYAINQSSTENADFDKLTISLKVNSPF